MEKSTLTLDQIINAASVNAVVVTITPELAHKMLERNTSNRPISKGVVDRYADSMKKGLWQLNAQSIVFNTNGELTDGQHRLYAVIQSECTIQSLVAGGVAPEAFSTYDCGRSRTLGQLIGMSGVPNYNAVASIVNNYYAIKNGINHYDNAGKRIHICSTHKPSNSELIAIYNTNSEKYNFYGERAQKLNNLVKKSAISCSYAASVWMYLVEDLGYPQSMAQSFFLQLFSLDSSPNITIDYTRKRLLNMRYGDLADITRNNKNKKDSNYCYTMQYKVDLLTKTWNLYAMGKDVKIVSITEKDKGAPFITPQQADACKNE